MFSHFFQFLTTLVATESCSPGFYAVSTKDGQECVPCSVCEAGQGVVTPCGSFNDTECSNCSEGYFSRLTASGQECTQCESCSPERIETSPCTSTQNSVCGRCSGGYFLYVDNDGSACRPCSLCPAGIVAVRWIECAEAGEPLHNQCAPGKSTILITLHNHKWFVCRRMDGCNQLNNCCTHSYNC